MIPEEDIPSPEEEGQTEDGSRQNWDGRQAEMTERTRGITLDAASGIEIALEATTPNQKGSETSGGGNCKWRCERSLTMKVQKTARKPSRNGSGHGEHR